MDDYFEQTPFIYAEFAENPEPRCPCLLLLDTSSSMRGDPIQELNEGIQTFKDELTADALTMKRVEVGIVTFGPVQIITEFQTPDTFQPTSLKARGDTPIGGAIVQGIEMIKNRKEIYKRNGISYYRPWLFLITDGGPTDSWKNAAQLIRAGEESKAFMFYAVGVEGANMEILRQLSVREPLRLRGLRFRDFFLWLSNSMGRVSQSNLGDKVALSNPAAPEGWAIAE